MLMLLLQAFVNAWSAACHNTTTPSTFIIPAGMTFLLSRIDFQGPCNNVIYVAVYIYSIHITYILYSICLRKIDTLFLCKIKVDGNLKRTNEIWQEGYSWLLFVRINGLTISGSGELDGQGTNWWSCKEKDVIN